ncbi:hypothetical protein [Actinoplanes sp. NPDC048796]|uniref:hypothetical protein n=1 Tax=Actinoplanes sp. NPDC048796 TaxID=3155640 RepID=UPI0033E45121
MTPARSLAASVVALGFTGALSAPLPAFAAPAPCERAESYAAQSGAELLRIEKLAVQVPDVRYKKPKAETETESGPATGAAARVLDSVDDPITDPEESDTLSEGIGMLGTAMLGTLTPHPKAKAGTDGEADVVTPADEVTGRLGEAAEQGGSLVNGLTRAPGDSGGSGAGTSMEDPAAGAKADEDAADEGRADKSEEPSEDAVKESGRTATLSDVGVGETRTAMIAEAKVSSAAYGRLLDGQAAGKAGLSKPLLQKAPPTNPKAAQRVTPAGKAGPLKLGAGRLAAHARWEAGMACGRAVGETTRSEAGLTSLRLLDGLVRVPEKLTSESTTALERSGEAARSVASSTVKAGRIELADGRVRVRVLRAPTLTTSMSAAEGGKVEYRPAVVEVSGDGIATKRLEAAGDHAEITLTPERHATESVPLGRLSDLAALNKAKQLPVPAVPGLPPVSAAPRTESAPSATHGTRLRVSLGDVRQATKGSAVAARAAAVKVSLVQAAAAGPKDRDRPGYGPQARTTVDLAFGVLESAAVSPAAAPPAGTGGAGAGGAGGGLPVTGPRLDRLAMAGGTLLVAGIAAVAVTMRRRRSRP